MYYNKEGQPIDYLGRPIAQPLTQTFNPYQQNPVTSFSANNQSQDQWNLKPNNNDKTGTNETVFLDLTSADNIQEVGNKEARLGETLYYYNKISGELYKKYVDFLTGHMVVESATFVKAPEMAQNNAQNDPRIDQLLDKIKELENVSKPTQSDPRVDDLLYKVELLNSSTLKDPRVDDILETINTLQPTVAEVSHDPRIDDIAKDVTSFKRQLTDLKRQIKELKEEATSGEKKK